MFKKTPEQRGHKIAKYSDSGKYENDITQLLEEGAVLPEKTPRGSGLLATAVYNRHLPLIKACIDQGLDLQTPNRHGWSPLKTAVIFGRDNVVRQLFDAGVIISAEEKTGQTLLMTALYHGKLPVAQLLCEKGFSLHDVHNGGYTCVTAAIASGNADVLRYVLDARPALHHVHDGKDFLQQVLERNNEAMFDMLIAAGMPMDFERKAYGGKALLQYAKYWKSYSPITRKLAQMQKAQRAQMRLAAQKSALGWRLETADTVCHLSEVRVAEYKVTEIFNFRAGTYTRINQNIQTKAESASVLPLDQLAHTELGQEALRQLQALGGAIPGSGDTQKKVNVRSPLSRGGL